MENDLLLLLLLSGLFIMALLIGISIAIVYFLVKRLFGKKIEYALKRGDDLARSIDQVNRARANDSKELKEKIGRIEEKVALLAKPSSKEKELALEKVFAKAK